MEKRFALIISFLVTLLIGVNYFFLGGFDDVDRVIVILSRAVDGDTVELEDGRKVRLLNVNTPESGREGYEEAKDFLKLYENKSVELEVIGVGKYGRSLGRLFFEGNYINLEIVRRGLAHTYLVEDGELKEFRNVEEQARENEVGIWEKSQNYSCLNAEINKKEENVVIEDSCGVNIEGWSVKDESTKRYVFEEDAGEKFVLFSGDGLNNGDELYWGKGKVWNNDKDSIFIRDSDGFLVYYDSYGY
jgi:micrococcal nuclease